MDEKPRINPKIGAHVGYERKKEERRQFIKEIRDEAIKEYKSSLVDSIEGMTVVGDFKPHTDERYHQDSYNQALQDMKLFINPTEKK